jgi:hypothetical protein
MTDVNGWGRGMGVVVELFAELARQRSLRRVKGAKLTKTSH